MAGCGGEHTVEDWWVTAILEGRCRKEVRPWSQPGPGWAGLKGQAQGLGLNSRGSRELLMVSEAASDWIELDVLKTPGCA